MTLGNKRGQEGVTLTTILLLILGVVVVVMVILFATGFFDKLDNATGSAGSKLDIAVKACQLVGSQGLTADYCLAYREIEVDGESMFVTCPYTAIQNLIDKTATGSITCTSEQHPSAKDYCTNEKLSGSQKIYDFSSSSLKKCSELSA